MQCPPFGHSGLALPIHHFMCVPILPFVKICNMPGQLNISYRLNLGPIKWDSIWVTHCPAGQGLLKLS